MSDRQQDGTDQREQAHLGRRQVVAGAGLVGLAGALAACGTAAPTTNTTAPGPTAPPAPSVGTGAPTGEITLAKAADIPVGGGAIFPEIRVVVTQPTAGHFEAFSAICTHERCTVSQVANGTINCPCHGSQFSIIDGSVVHGPAAQPLHPRSVTVKDGTVALTQ